MDGALIWLDQISVNSSNFIEFLKDLRKFIETKWTTFKRRTIILLVNASPHSTKQTTKFITENLDTVFYLPQYTPVDNFFSLFKSKLWKFNRMTTNLNWDFVIKWMKKWWKVIKIKEILGMWKHQFQTIKDNHWVLWEKKNIFLWNQNTLIFQLLLKLDD